MTELGERLLARAEASFANKLKKDSKLRQLARKARKTTSYKVANEYSARAGELCSEALKETCGDMETMAQVAGEVLPPVLDADHKVVSEVSQQVLSNIIGENGLELPALPAELDLNRVSGLITAAQAPLPESWELFAERIINFSQAVADETLRKNAARDAGLGLEPVIVRETDAPSVTPGLKTVRSKKGKVYKYPYSKYAGYEKPCEWCKQLAGTYAYKDVGDRGNDVFRRHRGCRCTTEYRFNGLRQDVWSKTVWTDEDADKSKEKIAQTMERRQQEQKAKETRMAKKRAAVDEIQKVLRYSPAGAGKFYNAYKDQIDKYGLDYVLELALQNRR